MQPKTLLAFLFCLGTACQSRSDHAAQPRTDVAVTASTATTATATGTTAVEFGGMFLFRMNDAQVELSYTDFEDDVQRLPSGRCTLASPACTWKFHAIFWNTGALTDVVSGDTRALALIFRPNGNELEDADVRIYADGKRLAAMLLWQPPHNSTQTELAIETDENDIRCRKKP